MCRAKSFLIILAVLLVFPPSSVRAYQVGKRHRPSVAQRTADYGRYNFSFTTLEGRRISLSDYAGKVVLVNLWAPWCAPCKKEIPGFQNLYKRYHRKGFEVLGVAVQTNETDVRSFVEAYKMVWPIGIKDAVAVGYKTYVLPDTYLFRTDGSLAKHFVGYTAEEALRPLLEELLRTPK